jgi:predicted lipoprotein with Yx(FWY)xxD motif
MPYGRMRGAALTVAVGCAIAVGHVSIAAQGQGRGAAAAMPAGVHAMKVASGATALADGSMMTLYTFAKDMPGVSNCNDNCAKNWPPLTAAADAKPMGDWTIITRADGTKQWAYKGMPLYKWIKDGKPGDASGDGMGQGAWKVAVP